MTKNLSIITKVTLWALFAISIVVALMLAFGGDNDPLEVGGDMLWNPKYSDALIVWGYALVGLSLLITVVMSLVQFVQTLINNPKKGMKSLAIIVVFCLVFVVSWFVGSADEVKIVGYEGSDNVGFWPQFTDMVVYSIYTLAIGTLVALIGSALYSKFK